MNDHVCGPLRCCASPCRYQPPLGDEELRAAWIFDDEAIDLGDEHQADASTAPAASASAAPSAHSEQASIDAPAEQRDGPKRKRRKRRRGGEETKQVQEAGDE